MPAVLLANSIFNSVEHKTPLLFADDIDSLKAFVESEKVTTYSETIPHPMNPERSHVFYKSFKKGGVLENYNVPSEADYMEIPTREQALADEGRRYDRFIARLKKV